MNKLTTTIADIAVDLVMDILMAVWKALTESGRSV